LLNDLGAARAAIDYIESNLDRNLDLDTIAAQVKYSKYHLHRSFAQACGTTMGDYIARRRLTEAAKMLVLTDWPVLDIAVSVGFGGQQSFAAAFKRMYKKTPVQFRRDEEFYALQLRIALADELTGKRLRRGASAETRFAAKEDVSAWMELLSLVVDGYPHLDESEYAEHLKRSIESREAIVLERGTKIVGAIAFRRDLGTIEFLGVHPQMRGSGISKVLMRSALQELAPEVETVSTTTFRAEDAADTGYREDLLALGFAEAEMLEELGYPTQRLLAAKSVLKEACDAR